MILPPMNPFHTCSSNLMHIPALRPPVAFPLALSSCCPPCLEWSHSPLSPCPPLLSWALWLPGHPCANSLQCGWQGRQEGNIHLRI